MRSAYLDRDNPFQWQKIHLKFLGDPRFSPSLPWVSNITKNRKFSSELYTYIDKIRKIYLSDEEGRVVGHRIAHSSYTWEFSMPHRRE